MSPFEVIVIVSLALIVVLMVCIWADINAIRFNTRWRS